MVHLGWPHVIAVLSIGVGLVAATWYFERREWLQGIRRRALTDSRRAFHDSRPPPVGKLPAIVYEARPRDPTDYMLRCGVLALGFDRPETLNNLELEQARIAAHRVWVAMWQAWAEERI